jgi:hypothetical protein
MKSAAANLDFETRGLDPRHAQDAAHSRARPDGSVLGADAC